MRSPRGSRFPWLVSLVLLVGCGSSDEDLFDESKTGNPSGSAGVAGSSSVGGSGGVAGSAGSTSGGKGGASGSAGKGGSAGSAGKGGAGGKGGAAGKGGSGNAGGSDAGAGGSDAGAGGSDAGAGGSDAGAGGSDAGAAGDGAGGDAGVGGDAGAAGDGVGGGASGAGGDAGVGGESGAGGSEAGAGGVAGEAGAGVGGESGSSGQGGAAGEAGQAGAAGQGGAGQAGEAGAAGQPGGAAGEAGQAGQAGAGGGAGEAGAAGSAGAVNADVCPGAPVTVGAGKTTVTGNTSTQGNNFSWGSDQCGGSKSNDAVYMVTVTENGYFKAQLLADDFNPSLYVRQVCDQQNTGVLCNANLLGNEANVQSGVLAGATFWVVVDGYGTGNEAGSYTLNMQLTPSVCGNGTTDPGEECDDANSNDGDGCSSCLLDPKCTEPEATENSYSKPQKAQSGCTTINFFPASLSTGDDNDWYCFKAEEGQTISAQTYTGSIGSCDKNPRNTLIELYKGMPGSSPGNNSCFQSGALECNDDINFGSLACSRVARKVGAGAGGEYCVRVIKSPISGGGIPEYGLFVTVK